MKRLTLNSVKKNNETSVSNIFLDTFMCSANGEFVKVYLYLLRCIDAPDGDITMSDIADKLNLTEKDVIRALKYWAGVQVLDVTFDKETGEASSVTILPLEDTESNTTISPGLIERTSFAPTASRAQLSLATTYDPSSVIP